MLVVPFPSCCFYLNRASACSWIQAGRITWAPAAGEAGAAGTPGQVTCSAQAHEPPQSQLISEKAS